MEVDTRATVLLISQRKLCDLFPKLHVKQSEVTLCTYTGEKMDVRGEIQVEAQYGEQKKSLTLVVIAGTGPVLLGRNWLQHLQLNWKELMDLAIHHAAADTLASTLDRYSIVFTEDLSSMKPFKAK